MAMGTDKKARILAGYHQYFAVKKAMECTKEAIKRQDGKIGVFWHTQGSGKSLSMVFYAHQLLHNLLSSTILVLNKAGQIQWAKDGSLTPEEVDHVIALAQKLINE